MKQDIKINEQKICEQKNRKWIKPVDIVVIGVMILVLFLILILARKTQKQNGSNIVQISYDGKIVEEFLLNEQENRIFRLSENENVGFKIENHEICFIDVNCPDKLCENFGKLNKNGDVAICLPNKVTLKIVTDNNNDEIDAIIN